MTGGDNVMFAVGALMLGATAITASLREPYRKFHKVPFLLFACAIGSHTDRLVNWRSSFEYLEEGAYLLCALMIAAAIAIHGKNELSEDLRR
jgi:hypothetical protein